MTPKQEKFCQTYIECGNASKAYRQSYDAEKMNANSIHKAAYKLLHHEKVNARIAQLRNENLKRHHITVDSLTAELDETRKLAIDKGQSSAAVSAIMGKAKLHGLLSDKLQQLTFDDNDSNTPPNNEVDNVELKNRCIWYLAEDDAGRAKKIAGFVKTLVT